MQEFGARSSRSTTAASDTCFSLGTGILAPRTRERNARNSSISWPSTWRTLAEPTSETRLPRLRGSLAEQEILVLEREQGGALSALLSARGLGRRAGRRADTP
jgi:hypothetical protein